MSTEHKDFVVLWSHQSHVLCSCRRDLIAAKDIKKEISPLIANENEKTTTMIKKFEEDLKVYFTELKKRDFYFYKTGVDESKKKLASVNEEIAIFDQKVIDYGYNAQKFGNPDLITNSQKQVESIRTEI